MSVPPQRWSSPLPIGRRGALLLCVVLFGLWSWWGLDLGLADLIPREGWARAASRFFAAALQPAMSYEAELVPEGTAPFLFKVLDGVRRTIIFAATSMSLALVGGALLGFLASTSSWSGDPAGGTTRMSRAWRRVVGPFLQSVARLVIALLRSVHELLWAVVFLAAMGFHTGSAVIALAIPYAGTLAKIFSEIVDEAPRDAAKSIRAAGASPVQVFLFGQLPRAMPDLISYVFYLLECAIRSSAVLGFFGFETLGYYLSLSFENQQYREVWTYLYALIALVLLLEAWSGQIRRRLSA